MKSAENIYALLTPIAIVFVIIEVAINYYYKKGLIRFHEFIANFGTAIANQTVNVLVAAGVYVVYGYLWENFRIIDNIPMTWYNFLFLLLGVDFIFYWVHRWGHHINIMWAAHSPHHSAEEMNFAVALRASVTQRLFSFLFFWPLTIIGFNPFDIYAMTGLHLFISFMHHTELIPKLWRWIEFIFTTPSHHRVHHGVNYKYLDKNFGEFLIIWDRLFGTFEEETDKVVYGMYSHPKSWNPIKINFHYYVLLWEQAKKAPYFWDKIRIWFMPLGWVPRGLEDKGMPEEITIHNQVKYSSTPFKNSGFFLVLQLGFALWLMLLVIRQNDALPNELRWFGALILWQMIFNWSEIMESRVRGIYSEWVRMILVGVFLYLLPNELAWYSYVILGVYLSVSFAYTMYFLKVGQGNEEIEWATP